EAREGSCERRAQRAGPEDRDGQRVPSASARAQSQHAGPRHAGRSGVLPAGPPEEAMNACNRIGRSDSPGACATRDGRARAPGKEFSGVPRRIRSTEPTHMRLHEPFEYHARTAPDRPCAEDGERRLTYGEMARETDRLVNALRAEGLKPGDRFAMLSRNSADMVAGYLAASKSGCVALPLNWRLAPGEWKQILTQGGAKLVIAQDEFVDAFAKTGLDLPVFPGKSYRAWLDAQPDRATAADGGDDTVLYQMYTSGTTGEPKGALLTHYAVLNNSLQTLPVFEH